MKALPWRRGFMGVREIAPAREDCPCAQSFYCSCCRPSFPAPMPPISRAPRGSMPSSSFRRAPRSRVGKVRLEAGDHVVLFADLPARAIASSIRVEGKATAKLDIGSVDSRRRMFVPRTDDAVAATEKARRGRHRKLKDDEALLRGGRAGGRSAEVADRQPGAAAESPGARHRSRSAAARLDADFRHHRPALRRGESHPGDAGQDARARPPDQRPGQARLLAPAQDERTEVKIFVNAAAPLEADIAIRTKSGRHRGCPSTTRASPPAPRRKPQAAARAPRSIQQRSGESWDEVALALSTTRPGAGTAAPELRP